NKGRRWPHGPSIRTSFFALRQAYHRTQNQAGRHPNTSPAIRQAAILDALSRQRTLAMQIQIFTTGGTFDKVYYDDLSEFQIGEPMAGDILREAGVTLDYQVQSLLKKDSLDMDDADRARIHAAVSACP